MMREGALETSPARSGLGIAQALRLAFQPDQAANDVLGRLIEQIDGLNWPKSGEGKPTQ